MSSSFFLAGIDENGLGPRLGPLLVTGVLARATEKGRRCALRPARGSLGARLGDSKKLVAFNDSALGEAWARALLERRGHNPASPAEALRLLSVDGEESLRSRCPEDHGDQCWGTSGEVFEAEASLVATLARDLDALDRRGLTIDSVRLAIVCTERLNDALARGFSRFDVDLHTMERLALAFRSEAERDLEIVCGKVGGIDRYTPRFGPFQNTLHSALVEGRARSEYAVMGVGTVAFVRDADETSLLVGLASLVGKWARDVLMRRIVRFYQAVDDKLPMASGYHDPVTSRFIEASALLRKTRGLPNACFERAAPEVTLDRD